MQTLGMETDTSGVTTPLQKQGRWWLETEAVLLMLLVTAIYFSRLSEPSIRGEESRRGRIAWEMIETGDWIVPRVQGEPLYSRPPLQNWTIALVGMARGKVDTLAVRLPSVLAVLLTSVMLYGYSRTFLRPIGAFAAGAAYATMGHVLELGRLGETEALFTFLVSGSLIVWHWGYLLRLPALWIWLPAYVLVGMGTLAKGPQAPVYFCGAVGLFLLLSGRWRFAVSWAHLAGITVFILIVAAWQIPCYFELGLSGIKRLYYADVALRFGDTRWITYAKHMVIFPVEVVCACLLPWSFLLIPYINPQFRRTIGSARPQVMFLTIAAGVAFLTVWLAPEAMPRYYMPLYPCFAPLIGLVVDRALNVDYAGKWQAIWPIFLRVMAPVMLVAGIAVPAVSFFLPDSLVAQRKEFGVVFMFLALGGSTSLWILARQCTPCRALTAMLVIGGFLGLACNGVIVNAQMRKSENASAAVARLRQELPVGTNLISLGQVHHLFLFHYGHIGTRPFPKDATEVEPNLSYFCFNCEGSQVPVPPFPWEQVDVISCDRYHRPAPDCRVVIGRRLNSIPKVVSQPQPALH